jgi:T-complex protein 1 subunit zeta
MSACFLYLSNYSHLLVNFKLVFANLEQRAQLGVEAFADALLVVPKTLAENSGLDTQDEIVALTVTISGIHPSSFFSGGAKDTRKETDLSFSCMFIQGEHDRDNIVGINLQTGGPLDPQVEGIFDNYSVKRQLINSGYT